jgi:hypothetical protein
MAQDKESEIVNRALGHKKNRSHPVNRGYKRLTYTDVDSLIHDVKSMYPSATDLMVINPDQRDSDGSPLMVTRKLRGVKFTSYTSGFNGSLCVNASWREVFAYIENGYVYLKVSNHTLGDTYY